MHGAGAGIGSQHDRSAERLNLVSAPRACRVHGRRKGRGESGKQFAVGVEVLADDRVLWIDGAGLDEQSLSLGAMTGVLRGGGALNQVCEAMLARDGERQGIFPVTRIQLRGVQELALGDEKVIVVQGARPMEVGIFRFA